ncbi:hypothetical protein QA596_03340 [Balneolales bacterium ANBcel1]|nr:hypothetical protein [Balneolales bacterium ANBcel1]
MDNAKFDLVGLSFRELSMSITVLQNQITKINKVSEWASLLGYSRSYFCRKFTAIYGENPKYVLRRAKLLSICKAIESDWSATSYKVAREAGQTDEKAMLKFLSRNYNTGFVNLRNFLKRQVFQRRKLTNGDGTATLEIPMLLQNAEVERLLLRDSEEAYLKPSGPSKVANGSNFSK